MAITLRKMPYPYKAMVAIDSDIDRTQASGDTAIEIPRRFNFETIHRYLNTTTETPLGTGLGLDIADSLFMYDKFCHLADLGETPTTRNTNQMSWFRGLSQIANDRQKIIRYINAGWIDGFHSFGDFSEISGYTETPACTREMVSNGLLDLQKYGIKIERWSDHGDQYNRQNVSNRGKNPVYPTVYHADLAVAHGVKFFWFGYSDTGSTNGGVDYHLHSDIRGDSVTVWAYRRYNPNWSPLELHLQFTAEMLASIKLNNHYFIAANHLGGHIWTANTIATLQTLKTEQDAGDILVSGVTRMLKYELAERFLNFSHDTGLNKITINSIDDTVFGAFVPTLNDVKGVTFLGTDANTTVYIGEALLTTSYVAESTTMIPWHEADTTDYVSATNWISPGRRPYVFVDPVFN